MRIGTDWRDGEGGALGALARAFTAASAGALDAVVRQLDGWESLPVRPDVLEVLAGALPLGEGVTLAEAQQRWFAFPGEATQWYPGTTSTSEMEAVLARGAVELARARLARPERRCDVRAQAGWPAFEAWVSSSDDAPSARLWLFVPANGAGVHRDDAQLADDGRLRGDLVARVVRDREPSDDDVPGAAATGPVRTLLRIGWARHLGRARGLSRAAAQGPAARRPAVDAPTHR